MYKRLAAILFPVVTIMLIGAGVWGYQENQEKNSILIKAENQYQRAFHDLSFHMDSLQDELSKVRAVNSDGQTRKSFIKVWKLATQAQNEINQLPLTLMPFSKTEEFLSKIADFTYRNAMRDMSKQPLSEQEKKTVVTLNQHARQISEELRGVQDKIIKNHLRWMDVELALASEDKPMDNTIIDGFKTIDKQVAGYSSDVDWGPSMMSIADKNKTKYSRIMGTEISKAEAAKKAAQFLGWKSTTGMTVVENGKGLEYQSYSVRAVKPGTKEEVYLDLTKKGGQVIWMMDTTTSKDKPINKSQAKNKAIQFLADRGLKNMVPVSADDYGDSTVLTLAPMQDGVILYPDTAVVKVQLGAGKVVSYQGNDYIFNHRKRVLPKPAISQEDAVKKVNGRMDVISTDLALIENTDGQEVVCYEFIGKMNGSMFRIYINARDGSEEDVEKLKDVNPDKSGNPNQG